MPEKALRFYVEFILGPLILLASITLTDKNTLKLAYRWIVATGAIVSLYILAYIINSGLDSIRRVAVGDGIPLAISANYLSSIFGIAIVIATAQILTEYSWKKSRLELIALPVLAFGLILTGSRAAMIGVGLSFILILLSTRSMRILVPTSALGVGSIIIVVVLRSFFNFTGGYRFTLEHILYSIGLLYNLITSSLQEVIQTPMSILFGVGFYRYAPISSPHVVDAGYPHNYLASAIIHIGFPTAIALALLILVTLKQLFILSIFQKESYYLPLATLCSLVVFLMYMMSEGRLTRMYSFWMFAGITQSLIRDI
ncbi:O-antigen ligase family protein [Natrinema longum]|uniref:Uncharacterized protein n=1 Tax=Natrinema longum TaxID=370324 RepID=A0A8A2UAD8_9EURY|nr:hypothetical protein [Natrinema longum]MBZ6496464.1 hypothetical protein [Natrinema longum]QSW85630.1 hypothetical protein J0X27_01945 [Natrinema longum]